jgi:transketolase
MTTSPIAIKLDARSKELRRLVLRGIAGGRRGHIGSSFSLVEILRVLYDDVLRYDPKNPSWPERDRCILSKGHGCLALYAVLADKGFFPAAELDKFCKRDGILGGHPERHKVPGVEASTGSLGHGMPIGIGMALNARIDKANYRVFVVGSDGESQEGSVWEGALAAAKHNLAELTVLIDYNKQQSYGLVSEVLGLEPILEKWRSFGFAADEVNGHDVAALRDLLQQIPLDPAKPTAIICHTVKGKGIKRCEQDLSWHHKTKVSDEELVVLREGLEEY